MEYRIEIPFLPLSANQAYGVSPQGRIYMKKDAVSDRDSIRTLAQMAGFQPDMTLRYSVQIDFFVKRIGRLDADNGCKLVLDGVFSSRSDQRVVEQHIYKRVDPQNEEHTVVIVRVL